MNLAKSVQALVTILEAVPGAAIPLVPFKLALQRYENENVERFTRLVSFQLSELQHQKLDYDFPGSERFASAVVIALRGAEEAESQRKLEYLANAFSNTFAAETSNLRYKDVLLKVLAGLTGDQIQVMVELEKRGVGFGSSNVRDTDLAGELGIPRDQLRTILLIEDRRHPGGTTCYG